MISGIELENAFYTSVLIIFEIENEYGIAIPEAVLMALEPWDKLTVRAFISAIQSVFDAAGKSESDARIATATAITKAFPSARKPLELDITILDAIEPNRDYGSNYK